MFWMQIYYVLFYEKKSFRIVMVSFIDILDSYYLKEDGEILAKELGMKLV